MNVQILSTFEKIRETFDAVFSCAALFAVPVIVIAPIGWYFDGGHRVSSSLHAAPSSTSHPSSELELSGDLAFDKEPLRVVYHLELVDSEGQGVKFPQVSSKGTPQFDNMILPVPPGLKPGSYQLVAKIRYTVNPITYVDKSIPVSYVQVR